MTGWALRTLPKSRTDEGLHLPTPLGKHCLHLISGLWLRATLSTSFTFIFGVIVCFSRLSLVPMIATLCPLQDYHVPVALTLSVLTVKINLLLATASLYPSL